MIMLITALGVAEPNRSTVPSITLSPEIPPPEVVQVVEGTDFSVVLVPQSRSEWVALHVCYNQEQQLWSLPVLERLYSRELSIYRSDFLFHGVQVSTSASWYRFCIQLQASKEHIKWGVEQSVKILKSISIRDNWSIIQQAYSEGIEQQSRYLASSHNVATNYLFWGTHFVEWDWTVSQLRRDFRRFFASSTRKIVIVGDYEPLEVWSLYSLVSQKKRNIDFTQPISRIHPERFECNAVEISGAKQIAVSVQMEFPLNRQKVRYLAEVLGGSIRSRLGQYLREELGLVYMIGAEPNGNIIEVSYSVDPPSLMDSIQAVKRVIRSLQSDKVTKNEMLQAKGAFSRKYRDVLENYHHLATMYSRYSNPLAWKQNLEDMWAVSVEDMSIEIIPNYWHWVISGDVITLREWFESCDSENRKWYQYEDIIQFSLPPSQTFLWR
jgi:hypothetical protein